MSQVKPRFDTHAGAPATLMASGARDLVYAGFWRRFFAIIIDTSILMIVSGLIGTSLMATATGGGAAASVDVAMQNLATVVVSLVYVVSFWVVKGATLGKMALGMRIVDARSGAPIGIGKSLLRYVGYFVSGLFVGLGFLWVAFDRRKQGWHDKIAGTAVMTLAASATRAKRRGRTSGAIYDNDRYDRYDRDDNKDDDDRDAGNDSDFGDSGSSD